MAWGDGDGSDTAARGGLAWGDGDGSETAARDGLAWGHGESKCCSETAASSSRELGLGEQETKQTVERQKRHSKNRCMKASNARGKKRR